mmetsp:Transcript_13825/g.34759  ORF Transcript_13825/g.34759 Transcript_13825/m.34759 type:complete len:208 (+) Transcript_13825:165-788(+)
MRKVRSRLFVVVALAALCCTAAAKPAAGAEAPRLSAPSPHFDLFEALEDLWQPFKPQTTSAPCLGGRLLSDSLWSEAAPLRADIQETDAAYTVQVDVPGRSKDDIQIEIERSVLRLSIEEACGQQQDQQDQLTTEGGEGEGDDDGRKVDAAKPRYLRRERPCASSSRVIKLRDVIDQEGVRAAVQDGVLTVHLPKDQAQMPKKIRIA